MKKKERLVVLLGAGASIKAGVLSTAEITKFVVASKLSGTPMNQIVIDDQLSKPFQMPTLPDQPIFKTIFQALRTKITEPNFEHILAALEDLTGLAVSHSNKPIAEDYVNVLSPFVWVDERYQVLRDSNFLDYARRHFFKAVLSRLQNGMGAASYKETEKFLTALQQKYNLSVFNLNYDEIVDCCAAINWYDGYTEPEGSPSYYLFNRQEFANNILSDRDIHCHMHGSVRFGYTGLVLENIAKFDTAYQASQTYDQKSGAGRLVKGASVPTAPIISGFNKAAKLTYSPVPYGYYFKAFSDTLINCNKLIVIGYGGLDDHINTWIDQFIRIHGDRRRVVYITPRTGKDIGEYTALTTLMQGLDGSVGGSDIVHNTSAFFDFTSPKSTEFHQFQNLALCAGGFPLHNFKATMNSILKFLAA